MILAQISPMLAISWSVALLVSMACIMGAVVAVTIGLMALVSVIRENRREKNHADE